MKIYNFRGDLTDNSAKKEALIIRALQVIMQHLMQYAALLVYVSVLKCAMGAVILKWRFGETPCTFQALVTSSICGFMNASHAACDTTL